MYTATLIDTPRESAETSLPTSILASISWKTVFIISIFLSLWVSAFAVVYSTNAARQTFSDLQSLRQEHDSLFLEWTQLLLEQSAWTDTGQIEQLAREELQMRLPATEEARFLVVGQNERI
jgi:cell division protein FtsL